MSRRAQLVPGLTARQAALPAKEPLHPTKEAGITFTGLGDAAGAAGIVGLLLGSVVLWGVWFISSTEPKRRRT